MTASGISPNRLRQLGNLEDLLAFLGDELDWPIDLTDPDDAMFDYSAAELGIAADQVPTLTAIRQLRPLTNRQPWGIFFLEFSGPRLLITPLRRLLQRLVTARRASRSHPTWDLEHLMFIVLTNNGEAVELHFVSFVANDSGQAEVMSLPWRPQQSPRQYLDRLAKELLPRLAWPAETADSAAWTTAWRRAFVLRHGEAIRSADRLAERMADVATQLRSSVTAALASEAASGPFHRLLRAVAHELMADVDEVKFADMCAQTLVYGTLTARVTDPEGFGASPTLTVVPLANRFLAAFFEQVHDQVIALELPDGGLEALVADLRGTDVEAILDKFGDNSKGGDPVVHFYEEFLKRYDRKMRADAGAFYTPQPVVEFMVRAVDEVMRTTFGLTEGLADRSSWEKVAHHLGVDVPKGVDPSSSFISMLDPATGTGTYLVEWMRRAESSFKSANPRGNWSARLQDFVLPSMHAFEMMLAPYAIAHLKVALEAHAEGLDGGSVSIHLTDTLEHPAAQASFETMTDPVAEEGRRAAELKLDQRFSVIIGNPPYDREQKAVGVGGHRKGGVVRHGVPGIAPLLDDITAVMSAAGLGVHIKNLYNDYVYFWRWATWQATQMPEGPGVVAFITAASFLDGKSMGGLRAHLRKVFDELWIIDLGGEGRGANPEENVFDIRTPVAIAIGVRTTGSADCAVRYVRVSGDRAAKFGWLKGHGLADAVVPIGGDGVETMAPSSTATYFDWPEVTQIFPWIHSGAQFKRTWPIGPTKSLLERRWEELTSAGKGARPDMLRETGFRSATGAYEPLLSEGRRLKTLAALRQGDSPESIERYAYRSFDRQWVIADSRVSDRPRPDLWSVRGERQVFLTTLTSTKLGRGPVATAAPYVPDLHHVRGSYGAKDVMPLWRDARGKHPNVSKGLVGLLQPRWGGLVGPVDVLAYVYGLAGTPAFAEAFEAELAVAAGPFRVPVTADGELARQVMDLGRRLLWIHTWGERFGPADADWPTPGDLIRELTPIKGYPDGFAHDRSVNELVVGTGRFAPVSQDMWDFEVSGMKVIQSWLARRMQEGKGKRSSPLDDIRPERWTFTAELLQLLSMVEQTVSLAPSAANLIAQVIAGELIVAADLPTPTEAECKAAGV